MNTDQVVRYFETLTPQSVEEMGRYYTEGAYFKDPFNEVRRLRDIQIIFRHMFETLIDPRFVIVNRIEQASQAVLEWDFTFRIKNFRPTELHIIHGVSHLRFATDGRIDSHRDYWDTGEELFARLPLIGSMTRFLRNRMRAPGTGQ